MLVKNKKEPWGQTVSRFLATTTRRDLVLAEFLRWLDLYGHSIVPSRLQPLDVLGDIVQAPLRRFAPG